MRFIRILVLLLAYAVSMAPLGAQAKSNPTAEPKTQPAVNFFNPSRGFKRPVLNFFEKIGFSANSVFMSRYMWNGLAYSRGPVWQPNAAVQFYGFGLSVLGNFVLSSEPNQGEFNEVDFAGYYGTKVKKLEIDVSLTYALYPNDDPTSLNFSQNCLEGSLHLSYPLGPISLFTDISTWFIPRAGGFFADIGVGYQKNLPLNFAMTTAILIGFSNNIYNQMFIADVPGGPNLFNFNLTFPWSPVKGLIITPELNVSTLLTGALLAAQRLPTHISGDLTIGYNF